MPKVSICIPAYNKAKYLPATIESALAQKYDDFEVIISDNASTDETPEVCRSYTDTRLRYVRFDTVGQTANVNHCLSLARGEYLTLLCHDDLLDSDFLSHTTAVLDKNPQVGLVHCAAQSIDENDAPLRSVRPLYESDRIEPGEALLRRLLLEGCLVYIAGVMIRRSVYEETGGFSAEAVWGIDWHLWMRFCLLSGAAYIVKPLALYREHSANLTSAVLKSGRNAADEVKMLEDIFRRIDSGRSDLHALRPRAFRNIARRTWFEAEQLCIKGEGGAARIQLREAIRVDPSLLLDYRTVVLWAASHCGYDWFARLQNCKRRLIPAKKETPAS